MNSSTNNNIILHQHHQEEGGAMKNSSSVENIADMGNMVFGIVNTLLGIAIVFGNSIVIVAFSKARTLQSCAGFIVLNMAVTDLLVGVVVLVLAAPSIFLNFYPYSGIVMRCIAFVSMTISYESVYSMTLVTLDRWLAVTKPDLYTVVVSKRKVGFYIAGFWCLALLNAGLGFIFPRCYAFPDDRFSLELSPMHCGPYSIYIHSSVYLFHFVVMLFCCTQIVREIRRKHRIIGASFEQSKLHPYFKQQVDFSKILVIILVVFVVSTYPYLLYRLVRKHDVCGRYMTFAGATMMFSNSVFHVVVYMLLATPIRRAVLSLFRKETSRRNRFELFIVSPSMIRRRSMESMFNK